MALENHVDSCKKEGEEEKEIGRVKRKFFNISKSALFVEPDRVQVTNIIFMSVFGSNMSSAYLFPKQKFYK